MENGATPARAEGANPATATDRRRARRHRAHTPLYASISGSAPGAANLSEVLNIAESGMSVQFSAPVRINRLLPLCLDLSETGARIYVIGHVVWSEPSGSTGIRFPEMSEPSLRELREWLEANDKAAAAPSRTFDSPELVAQPKAPESGRHKSLPGQVALTNEWAEIERELESCGADLEPALHLIAQRALTLTWSSGAAIALIDHSEPTRMVCRARAGSDSPEIGAQVELGAGFSGECIRSGKTIICDDTEDDRRVDRQSCRMLGVRSIVATPARRCGEIIGILEIFSPEPRAFRENDVAIMQRLAAFISHAVQRAESARAELMAFPSAEPHQIESADDAPRQIFAGPPSSPGRRIVLVSTGIACLVVAAWALAPSITRLVPSASHSDALAGSPPEQSSRNYAFLSISDLTARANQDDARAQYALAMRYANGTDVDLDFREAMQWFLRSAEGGSVRAQGKVAAAFWEGKGASQDYGRAYFWAVLAQAGGDELSRQIAMSSAARMSPAQIAAEQKEADEWLHSHNIGHAAQ